LWPVVVLLGFAVAHVGAGAQTLAAKPAERSTLTLGVFAYLGVEQTRRQYQPLVDYLNATLQREQVVLQVLLLVLLPLLRLFGFELLLSFSFSLNMDRLT
jgi:hypothetical protein